MRVTKEITIVLSIEEAQAIQMLLGKESDDSKKEAGLSSQQCVSTRELYNELSVFTDELTDDE